MHTQVNFTITILRSRSQKSWVIPFIQNSRKALGWGGEGMPKVQEETSGMIAVFTLLNHGNICPKHFWLSIVYCLSITHG
jgi:hypothetical protein